MSLVDIFDLVMLLIVAYFAVKGIFRGFFNELFSLVGIVSGLYFGFQHAGAAEKLLLGWFTFLNPSLARIIGIALIFFGVCVVCSLIGKLFSAVLSAASLGALDRFCGFLAGAAKGVAVVALIVIVLTRAQRFLPVDLLGESRVATIVNGLLPHVEQYIDEVFPKKV
jgi:membrane protein required for colicin V production